MCRSGAGEALRRVGGVRDHVLVADSAEPRPGQSAGEPPRRERAARLCVWTACAAGLVHAAFSLYWAFGGSWLLDTVGRQAVRISADARLLTGLGLGLVAFGKAAAALVPVWMAYGRLRRKKLWRGLTWAGAVLLVLYGGLNTVISNAVLAGMVSPDGGYNRPAMAGHAWLWDPLFLLWGLALLGYLLLSGRTGARR